MRLRLKNPRVKPEQMADPVKQKRIPIQLRSEIVIFESLYDPICVREISYEPCPETGMLYRWEWCIGVGQLANVSYRKS